MFTGLIEEIGTVFINAPMEGGHRLAFKAGTVLAGLKPNDSVAVNGVCLTVTNISHNGFEADAIRETLEKTTIPSWRTGQKVNLERAVRADQRFGGHIVQGHVDGVGRVMAVRHQGKGRIYEIEIAKELSRTIVLKGSIALDGVSLTVADESDGRVSVALIPHTLANTNFGMLVEGVYVNVETDIWAKYLGKWLNHQTTIRKDLSASRLNELGY